MTPRRAVQRLLALLRQGRLERELDNEVRAHLELAERDALARGLTAAEARDEARRAFGGVQQMKEIHRDDRSTRWIENLIRDIRYGAAALRRDPGFTFVAVSVLALGIGANTAMFSLVDGILFQPLPFPHPERIVRVWEAPTPSTSNSTTTRTFEELMRQSRSFEALSAESLSTATIPVNGEPTRLNGRYVSAGHFTVFGVEPLLGRAFRPEEDQPGAPRVLILSHAAWQTYFGGDRGLLGRELLLDNEPHQVIGVLPPGAFDRHRARPLQDPASFWRLNAFTPEELAASSHWLNPVGRLKPGVSLEQARSDVLSVRAQIADTIPAWKKDWSMTLEPFDQLLVGDRLRQSIYIALGAVVLVLLIACANITNLLLARSAARRKEMAVRVAIGATRGRIAAQLLTESLVLGALGGAAGVALAALLIQIAVPLVPAMPFTADVTLNLRVLAFATAMALAVSVLVGLLPAIRVSTGSAATALNQAGRGSSGGNDRARRIIVAAEVAVSVVLICGAFLLFKSLGNLQQVEIGARIERVLTMSLDLPYDRYPSGTHRAAFYPLLIERLRAVPGIESATVSGDVPLEGTGGENLRLPGREERVLVRFKRADSDYFSTLGIGLVAGRGFTPADRAGTPCVVVINEALARRLRDTFGIDPPVGASVDLPALGFERDRRAAMTIVGVAGNERVQSDLRAPIDEVAYVPMAQAPRMQVKLAVRTRGDAMAAVPAIREAVRQLDSRLALADIRTMEQIWERSLSGLREPVWLIGIFAMVSALLAAIGLYGVLSHSVTQQRREIGIRMALGARANDVLSFVARSTLTMVGLGLAAGLAGAFALTRVTSSLLFEVSARDPWAFVAGVLGMGATALVAALIPARGPRAWTRQRRYTATARTPVIKPSGYEPGGSVTQRSSNAAGPKT
ncbi:MAG: ABC transporter permease [Acidobacteriota bacterium]|nr:ABC transporter permease [Acidobacteriota bacterium]